MIHSKEERLLNSYNRGSRSEIREKRRKTNVILNSLIVLVIILIIVVSSIIFFGGNDDGAANKKDDDQIEDRQQNTDEMTDDDSSKEDMNRNDVSKEEPVSQDEPSMEEDKRNEEEADSNHSAELKIPPADEKDAVVTTGGENDNIKKTTENPNWQPIGTDQAGDHTSVFDRDSVDWTEMVQTISYATGVEESNMTIWFLGNNGHNRAVGTISAKDTKEKFKVYIDWVDGQGWKPTKVEELHEIENKQE